ncbi:type II secretion system F family protein [Vibrio tarriae]|uniref:type II secretion system F family protein n=1 Tax=Vibrio tarriae TaxID=2014742 RepID=UPI000DE2BA04|nr:type II secretion system F family protein [Vibrio tarriae]RBM42739.1 pilus assembly protein TadB [Vibrio tarriae]
MVWFVLIMLSWLILCGLVWIVLERQSAWQRQCQRYSPVSLAEDQADSPAFWQQWSWYQHMQTFISPRQLRQWGLLSLATLVIVPSVLCFNGMDFYIAIPLTLLTLVLVVWFAYQQLQQKRMERFRDELPDIIDGLIRALRVGAPMLAVFQDIANQHQGVTSRLFHQIVDELRVGRTMADVMKLAAQRMPIAEFRFLTIVLSLQQETGGRLANVLERLGNTLRSRAELNASIQTITSESRNSAKVLAALPVLVMLVLFSTGREHFNFLMATTGGQIVMIYITISILFGLFLIRRMTHLKG